MADTTVYFATNRMPDPSSPGGYGSAIVADPTPVSYAVVPVSRRDIAMDLSRVENRNRRLGFDGPADKGNPRTYTPATFRSVDCTEVYDFFGLIPFDATHQYYRRSRTVRGDITKLMAGAPVAPGVSSLSALFLGV
jgi:hypothetical protein